MKPIFTTLFAGLFLLLASQAFGQAPSMTTNFVVTEPVGPPNYPIGTKIVIELRVSNFTNIESMQFPITYNKLAMRFDSLRESAFSNWSNGNFISMPLAGKIGISWDGYSNGASMPFSFPNGTAIFKLYFTSIGDGLSIVNISPAAAPPALDIVGNGTPGTVNYQSGGTPTLTLGSGDPPPPPLVGFKIVANTIYIPQGERGCMPITVNDFDQIISMQWALHWDNTVLNYECTRRHNLSGLSATNFNPSPVMPATLLAGWDDPAGQGVSVVDGGRIGDICFKAVGAPGSTTTITIDGLGFAPGNGSAEAFNASSVNVWTQPNHPNGSSGVSAPLNIIVTNPPPTDVTYTVDTISAPQSTQACVAVKVKNFTAITNSEFALSYNPLELQYVSTQFGTNPLSLQAANITVPALPAPPLPPPALNYVKFLWANTNGVTVAADAAIFSACFNVLVPAPMKADVKFTSTVCPTITGIGTAKASGGVSMGKNNGWIKSQTNGPTWVVTHVKCNGGNTGAITQDISAGPAPTGYAWAGPGGFTSSSKDITGLVAGTYTVTVTYSGGNTVSVTGPVNQPAAMAQTNMVNTVSCFGGNNGAINLTPSGGTAPYAYMWTDGGVTTEDRTGLTVGIYTVTIKDVNQCSFGPVNIAVSGFTAVNVPSPNITNVSCSGLANGSIVINPQGGSGGYTYMWSNGITTKDLNNMPASTYTVKVTDSNGCSTVFPTSGPPFTIGSPQVLTSSLLGKTDVKCWNSPTGTATVDVMGGTGSMSYCWVNAANPTMCASQQKNPTTLIPGSYHLIVTDQNMCTSTHVQNVVISNPPSQLFITGTTTPSPCFEQSSGSICTTPAGGWGNYTYAWAGPTTPPAIACPSGLPGGIYTVTVTDISQCSATQTFTVGGSPAIVENNRAIQPVTCFGMGNGGVTLTLSGGNPPYSVTWSNTSLMGASISNLAPNSYQPTVTDIQGCTKVLVAAVVTGPNGPIANAASITEAGPTGGAIDLNPSGGTGDPNTWGYSWAGPNGFTATTQDIAGPTVVAGTYTVTVTDSNACTLSFVFTVNNANVVFNTVVDNILNSCSDDGSITLVIPPVAVTQTPFTITWGVNGLLETSSLMPTIPNLSAGVYNITVTADNGNSVVLTNVTVAQKDPASVNSNTTNPFSSLVKNGKITLTPAGVMCPSLNYQWGPAPLNSTSNVVSNLGQGTYFVTVTNPCSQCTSVHEFTLEYSPLTGISNQGSPTCSNDPTGFINVTVQGGNPPYTYDWSGPNGYQSSDEDISGLYPGVYSLVATDLDNRQFDSTYILTAQSNINITNVNETSLYPSGHQVSSADICDGEASVVFVPGVGASNILWSNGVTGADNASLCAGSYSVTVTDAAGCSSVWSDALTAPPAIAVTPESDGVLCHGDCDGFAKVFPTGGGAPYKVLWSTGQLDPLVQAGGFSQAVNLCGGDYSVTITDKNGVDKAFVVNVPEPAEIVVVFSPTTPRSFNACDGELLANATGAVFPITYTWSGSFGHTGDGERADNLCSGEFVEFFITDANGCTAYATDSVPYPEDGCFRVSPVITPGQQDGKNDFVVITCIETALENSMEIYNRWGQLVFGPERYSNNDADTEHNWNGLTNTGAALAEGVYYYVLTYTFIDDQGQQHEGVRKGAINLLR